MAAVDTSTPNEGLLDNTVTVDPLTQTRMTTTRAGKQRPPAAWGLPGLYVTMSPIPGLTPATVFPHNKPFTFQCAPMNEFGEDGNFNFSDYATVGHGSRSLRIGNELRTCQFETIFLDWEPPFAIARDGSGDYPAQKAVQDLAKIRNSGRAFQLLAHQSLQTAYEIDYAATLRSLSWKLQAGETDAYYVTVSFTEFRAPGITLTHPKVPTTLSVASLGSTNTLAKIAKKFYGDPSKWRDVAAANGLTSVSASTKLTAKLVPGGSIFVPASVNV